jgi:ketosteroid isomerase-like protein
MATAPPEARYWEAMSKESVEIIRGLYEAFNRRDLARSLESVDPDFEWIPDVRSFETPFRGRENVQRFFEDQIELLDLRVQPEEFFEKGSQVIAFIRARGRGQGSGAELDIRIAHVWTFRDGKPVRAEAYAERDKALEVAGLRE